MQQQDPAEKDQTLLKGIKHPQKDQTNQSVDMEEDKAIEKTLKYHDDYHYIQLSFPDVSQSQRLFKTNK